MKHLNIEVAIVNKKLIFIFFIDIFIYIDILKNGL